MRVRSAVERPIDGLRGVDGTQAAGSRVADSRVVDGILARLHAPGGLDAFCVQVRGARCCRRPVRLSGVVTGARADGGREVRFDTRALPDGVLLKACGTRRETLCPPCASLYRGDAFALVAAGMRGGKGVPEEIGDHPAVLLTLTAPSFGPVHRRCPDGTCHPWGRRCPHGIALTCASRLRIPANPDTQSGQSGHPGRRPSGGGVMGGCVVVV